MKLFYCCLFAGVFCLALADVKHVNVKESAVEKKVDAVATDKSSDSKPKRDASHLSGVYHGPSYKYLPPSSISSSYDSYSGSLGNSAGYSGGHISGVGGGYSSGGIGIGRGHNHVGFSSSGHYNSGASHGLGYAPASSYHGSGHHGLGFTSSGHYAGHGANQHSGGFKGGAGSHSGAAFGHGDFSAVRPHSYAVGHGYSSSGSSTSGLGYKSHSHNLGGANAGSGSGSGYHYSKGISGSFPAPSSSGFGSAQGFSSSHASGLAEVHHGDHVHNGGQEHIYVISNGPSGYGNSHGAVSVGHEVPTGSYLPPVQQHPLPSSSYGVPISTVGDSYNTKYHSQQSAVIEHGPAYAAGHKGLGHFGFAASKPQVLHTSITGSGFKQPSYSKAPFKPSEFLGAKYEGAAHNDAPGQQYLPPSGVGSDTTGYDYSIPSGSSVSYPEPSYQQTVEVQSTSVHEPDSAYLPPNNNEGSFNELPSAPSGNYLPPSNSYGVPYSH
ncbi:hornerin [Calliphora vicina]|uniref:hornerin n=1 Tax=Calliphora vicina TaxID=7373 RepID=UPI00325A8675